MKALLAAVCVAALLAPLAASAQERGGGRGEGRRGGDRPAASAPDRSSRPDSGWRGGGSQRGGAAEAQARAERQARSDRPARPERQAQAPRRADSSRERGWEGGRGGQTAQGRDANRWTGSPQRFDDRRPDVRRYDSRRNDQWRNDRRNYGGYSGARGYQRIRAAPFRWPRGYSAVRWSVRQRLPSVFLMPNYYIQDVYSIGLPYAPPGTEWVRVGNDALLVDLYTYEILDVAQDVFYW